MAASGYFPVSQSWAPGQWGCGAFVIALLLAFLIIGIVIFIYLLVVKPDGTRSASYPATFLVGVYRPLLGRCMPPALESTTQGPPARPMHSQGA
jgi:hypothetical protein